MALNDTALTTVARQKVFLGIAAADTTYDTILEILINMVSDFIEGWCDRTFLATAYSNVELDGTGTSKLLLPNFPVDDTATFSLEERDTALNISTWTSIDSDNYHVDYDTGILDFLGNIFRELPRHYRVTYTAGYAFKNDAAPLVTLESLKIGDLEYAVWKLVSEAFYKRKQAGEIQSESIGDYSVTYTKEQLSIVGVFDILNGYSRPSLF